MYRRKKEERHNRGRREEGGREGKRGNNTTAHCTHPTNGFLGSHLSQTVSATILPVINVLNTQ